MKTSVAFVSLALLASVALISQHSANSSNSLKLATANAQLSIMNDNYAKLVQTANQTTTNVANIYFNTGAVAGYLLKSAFPTNQFTDQQLLVAARQLHRLRQTNEILVTNP